MKTKEKVLPVVANPFTVPVPWMLNPVGEICIRGFYQEHGKGENKDKAVSIYSGAGCGNPFIQINIEEKNGQKRNVTLEMDIRKLIEFAWENSDAIFLEAPPCPTPH